MTTGSPVSTRFSFECWQAVSPSAYIHSWVPPPSPEAHSTAYTSQLLSHFVQNTDDLSRGSDRGTETVHPEQGFWDQHPGAGAGESPAAEAGQHCCSSAWTRSGRLKNSSQPHLTPLFCSDWNKRSYLWPYSPPRMQSQHLWNAAASATLNPQWGNQFCRSESEQKLQTLSKHHVSRAVYSRFTSVTLNPCL